MVAKRFLADPEESPRMRKISTPSASSDTSSPYFSAAPTSSIMPDPIPSYPSLDPTLFGESDANTSNYTTSAKATAPRILETIEEPESVEEHIRSVTPIKSTSRSVLGDDMLSFSPRSAGSPTSTAEPEDSRSINEKFWQMSKDAREEMYRDEFADIELELQDMELPPQYYNFPDFKDEILRAFLFHTRFIVKVWANYDSVEQQFYDHAERLKSCGKLDLSPKRYKHFENLDGEVFQFHKMRLDIGTPFRTLFNMLIDVEESRTSLSGWKLDVSFREVPDVRSPHYILESLLESASRSVMEDGVRKGQTGLMFSELEDIAKEFRYEARNIAAKGQFKGGSASGYGRGKMSGYGSMGRGGGSKSYGRTNAYGAVGVHGIPNVYGSTNHYTYGSATGYSNWNSNSTGYSSHFDQYGG